MLHAATQDLPCLRDIGMVPDRLFDTELAGRLAGFARVGLGAMVENVLGYALEKGHSAVDWSTRPLPEPWLRYAALDVELLVDLRDALEEELDRQGKLEWAHQEFDGDRRGPARPAAQGPVAAHVRHAQGAAAPADGRRAGAVERPATRSRSAATSRRARCWATRRSSRPRWPCRRTPTRWPRCPASATGWAGVSWSSGRPPWTGRGRSRTANSRSPGQPLAGPPPPRSWADKDPAAAARLSAARAAVTALAEQLQLPQENLITPDTVRRVCWEPPAELTPRPSPRRSPATARAPGRSSRSRRC